MWDFFYVTECIGYNNNCLFKVQYPISSVDYNKRYTYIIIVIQFNLYNAM